MPDCFVNLAFLFSSIMSKLIIIRAAIVNLFLALLLASCSSQAPREYVFSGETMGTSYGVKVVFNVPRSSVEKAQLGEEIEITLEQVNRLMSSYRDDSDVSRINAAEPGQLVVISPQTFEVISEAQRISQLTDGFFDITVGPLVDLWGFGPLFRFNENLPDELEVFAAKKQVGWNYLSLEEGVINKSQVVHVDLSAIAKGYAVDQVSKLLKSRGVESFLVEVGGEISVSGHNKSGNDWVLGIERPDYTQRKAFATLSLQGHSLATSGDYRNFYESNGQRYSHTINPKTGYPVKHKLASVSVIARACMEADALATALMAMGEIDGYQYAVQHGINAYFIYRENDRFESVFTPGFKPFLN